MPNTSKRHHYIPKFYSRRWVGADGKLSAYAMPKSEVVVRRRAPKEVGHHDDLYALPSATSIDPRWLEHNFFSGLDDRAAKALLRIEDCSLLGPAEPTIDFKMRSDWARFLNSLRFRMPEDMEGLAERFRALVASVDSGQEEELQQLRADGLVSADIETMEDFVKAWPATFVEAEASKSLARLIDNAEVGNLVINMDWNVLNFGSSAPKLLTSDRPLIFWPPLSGPQGHVALPIGPRDLFVASFDKEFLAKLEAAPRVGLAEEANRQVVAPAVKYVYGHDKRQGDFVKAHMRTVSAARSIHHLLSPAPRGRRPQATNI